MGVVNRFQIVAACAVVIFLLGLVRASRILFSSSVARDTTAFNVPSSGQTPLTLPSDETFQTIPREVSRNPFEEPSPWRPPAPGDLPPPSVVDLLRLTPAPLLLRPDGVPRMGSIPQSPEKRADSKLLMQLRRIFQASSRKESAE